MAEFSFSEMHPEIHHSVACRDNCLLTLKSQTNENEYLTTWSFVLSYGTLILQKAKLWSPVTISQDTPSNRLLFNTTVNKQSSYPTTQVF